MKMTGFQDLPVKLLILNFISAKIKLSVQIIIVGGHIDSWDIGQGAHDDGGACIAAWEVLRTLNKLNLKPKRTIRCVLWTNKENGLSGAKAYKKIQIPDLKNHILIARENA
jgi:carboxypeptidase Q